MRKSADNILTELEWRGLIHQSTHLEALRSHLNFPRVVFCGFDPTKDSLTIGNLVSICLLKRFEQFGHTPVVIMGGGTGLIGDPSGKESERQVLSQNQIDQNISGQRVIFDQLLSSAVVLNNIDWIGKLSFVDVLRDIGKHFSVNKMIQKDSVKSRLENREQGISFTEFSYMLLQAFDFKFLFENHNVTVQIGGSDQWGNIVSGTELVRKTNQKEVFGLTTPLLTKSDGGKFGKTESGAVWLTKNHTSPFQFFQFWINSSDSDVETFFKVFSFKSKEEIEAILAEHKKNPAQRSAQNILAEELTLLLHGETGLSEVKKANGLLFNPVGNQKLSENVSLEVLLDAFASAPSSDHKLEELGCKNDNMVIELLVQTSLAKSKREARQLIDSNSISINGKLIDNTFKLDKQSLLHDRIILLKKGKKNWHVTNWL